MNTLPLNLSDEAALLARLNVPLAVKDIIRLGDMPEGGDYALHEMLSDMQPDTALLAIASSIPALACQKGKKQIIPLTLLQDEASRIMNDYAPLWLAHARGRCAADEHAVLQKLEPVAEDLEAIADMLGRAYDTFTRHKRTLEATLCRIMRVQAQAQAEIAKAYLEALEEQTGAIKITVPLIAAQDMPDNVIPFRTKP